MTFYYENGGVVSIMIDIKKSDVDYKISLAYGAYCQVNTELDADLIRNIKNNNITHIYMSIKYNDIEEKYQIINWLNKYTTPTGRVARPGKELIERGVDRNFFIAKRIKNYLYSGGPRPSVLREV
ncbi:hypothetical protein GL297_08050 [Komagataeibacter sp. FXV2]|nr:hypothetical protein [Komagataeibacter sp. FXV2]